MEKKEALRDILLKYGTGYTKKAHKKTENITHQNTSKGNNRLNQFE